MIPATLQANPELDRWVRFEPRRLTTWDNFKLPKRGG